MFILPGSQLAGMHSLHQHSLLPRSFHICCYLCNDSNCIQQTIVALWGVAVIWLYANDIVEVYHTPKTITPS